MSDLAFPANRDGQLVSTGMKLRDYFAAQALAGILSNPENTISSPGAVAKAYRIADEMLKARSQPERPAE